MEDTGLMQIPFRLATPRRDYPLLAPLLAISALCSMPGCAEERPTIDRVQPNALEKSFFIGDLDDPQDDPVFFTRNFVVDSTESESLVGLSGASGLERIRWEITEDMLLARRAYAETGGSPRGDNVEPDGTVIAAYKVEEHFDIRYAYNPSTGEELNVEEENTTDQPWQDRAFFRVDWSENLVNSPTWTGMFFGKMFGDIEVSAVKYDVSDPENDDAPFFDAEEGYFDITSHFLVEPRTTRMWGMDIPVCYVMGIVTGSAIYSCDPQEAVVRSSYWKVAEGDPDDDYEPFENSGAPLDVFGNPGGIGTSAEVGVITPPRETYDPGYGYTDPGVQRFMNRHNIWQRNHQTADECDSDSDCGAGTCLDSGVCTIPCDYAARVDADGNGTDDQCENSVTGYDGSEGSQCSARSRCTIPYRDREIKPVAYFMNPKMPDDLQDDVDRDGDFKKLGPSEDLLYTWNQSLQVAVAHAREVECRRTAGATLAATEATRQECHAKYFKTENGRDEIQMVSYGGWGLDTPKDKNDVLVPCHNPVRSYDDDTCGQEGEVSRVGDLRKNFLIYWPYNTDAPYGGIGNWRGDPLTGQILGAAATTIGRSATRAAASVRDIVMVAMGELDVEDITGGATAYLYQKQLRNGRKPQALTEEQIARGLEAIDHAHLGDTLQFDLSGLATDDLNAAKAQIKSHTFVDTGRGFLAQATIDAEAKGLLGTRLELDMVSPDWVMDSLGMSPATELSDQILESASPLRGQGIGRLTLLDQQYLQAMGQRGACFMQGLTTVGSPDIHGMGEYFRQKYPDLSGNDLAEAIYEDLWRESYKGIELHEIGHSLGLLHNFTSSYDSMNFIPQYWQLRTHDGASTQSCNGSPRSGDPAAVGEDSCMGPRYLDPETDDELGQGGEPRPGINYYGHTSTMEYQSTRFFESVGLGEYDNMAMGALYGGVLETYDPNRLDREVQKALEPLHTSQLIDEWLVANTAGNLVGRHYTELARDISVFDPDRCRDATSRERDKAEWRIVHGQVCAPPTKDYGAWQDFADTSEPGAARQTLARKLRVPTSAQVPAAGNVRWPYRFGGDIANSYMHVNPFDSGADAWELTREAIDKNDYNYPLNYFRSHRRTWNALTLPSYTARRFYERLRSYNWSISFTDAIYQDLIKQDSSVRGPIEQLQADDNELRPYLLAQREMLRGLAQTFMSPEPGTYSATPTPDGAFDLLRFGANEPLFELDVSQARFIAPDYDSGPDAGGSWMYQDFANYAGYDVEKSIAARALTDGRPVFFSISRDNYLDNRRVNINFRSSMPQGVDRLLGGVLSHDWETVAPIIQGAAEPVVEMRDLTSQDLSAPLPTSTRALFPNVGYNQEISSLIFAQLFGRVNGDLALSNKLRMWIDGSASAELDIPEAEQIRFMDPDTGVTYIARRFGPEVLYGKTVDRGITSRMLAHANDLLAKSFVLQTNEEGEPLSDQFGTPAIERDEQGMPMRSDNAGASVSYANLRAYVGVLDATVQLSTYIGYGPFNWF